MEDWKKYKEEAESYAKAAMGAFNKKKLGGHVVYNLIGLAIESYLTAMCMKLEMMPEHSSIGSMLALLKKHIEIPESFFGEARFMNKFMNFCSLEIMDTPEPGTEDLARMIEFTRNVKEFAERMLGSEAKAV